MLRRKENKFVLHCAGHSSNSRRIGRNAWVIKQAPAGLSPRRGAMHLLLDAAHRQSVRLKVGIYHQREPFYSRLQSHVPRFGKRGKRGELVAFQFYS